MCLMKVKYVEAQGGRLVMDNVTTLRQGPDGLVLESLLDGVRTVPGTAVDSIDFNSGEARIVAAPASTDTLSAKEAG